MKSKFLITAIVLIFFGATAAKLISNKESVEQKIFRPDPNRKVLVEARTITEMPFGQQLTYTGTFAPNREAMIIPQIQGEVTGVYFNEGDVIRQGQLLAQVDDDLLQAQLIAAEANFETAQKNLERYTNASAGGGVSQLQVDNAKLNLKSTDSQLRQLKKQIDLCRIKAPFTGTITMRNVEMGAIIGSQPIGRITDISFLKLEIFVAEKEVTYFREGDTMQIETASYPGETIPGYIEYVANRADEAHNYLVRIVVRNNASGQLKAGMYGTAGFNRQVKESALAIPRTALLGSTKSPEVYVIENGMAVLRRVQQGKANEEWIEIVSGLQAGDIVITSGHINLAPGTPVQIAE